MNSENIKAVVEIKAHDRWEGNSRVRLEFFASEKAADRFVEKWNKKHCPPVRDVPDYYVEARKIT